MNFLLTGANGDIADAINRIIQDSLPKSKVFGCDAGDLQPASFFMEDVSRVPYASDNEYIGQLNKLINKYNIDILVPTTEPELLKVGSHINEINTKILMNDISIVELFLDKLEAYYWFEKNKLPMPITKELSEATECDLPIIVKYRASCGSKDIKIITDTKSLEHEKSWRKDSIFQHYIDSDIEYTCALIRANNQISTLIMQRDLVNGTTWKITTIDNEKVTRLLHDIANNIEGDFNINVQLRMKNDEPHVFEINPRFSGTIMMRHMIGFSDFLWTLNNQINYQSKISGGINIYRRAVEFLPSINNLDNFKKAL